MNKTIYQYNIKITALLLVVGLLSPSVLVFAQESSLIAPVEVPVVAPVETPSEPIADIVLPSTDSSLTILPSTDMMPIHDEPAIPDTVNVDNNNEKTKSPKDSEAKDLTDSSMSAMSSSSSGGSAGEVSPTSISHITVDVDQASGALNYNYGLTVPAGRNSMTPTVNISYNSEDKNNTTVLGLGWALSIPKIERINKRGTDVLYSNQDFRSSLSGELKYISGNQYGAKVDDGSFLNYQLASGVWTATAKDGTIYTFGGVSSAKLSDPSDASKIYSWYVTKVQDTNGNFITYNYYKDTTNNAIYPDTIIYTNNGANTGIYTVSFLRESRPDQYVSYAPGFLNEVTQRINEIRILTNGSWTKKYVLSYVLGDNGSRSMLQSITETGKDEVGVTTTLPALNLSYTPLNNNFVNNLTFTLPALTPPVEFSNPYIRIMDVNGDGLKDIVRSEYLGGNNLFYVLINNGNGWEVDSSWTQPEYDYKDDQGSNVHENFVFDDKVVIGDWNGDGKDDLVKFWPVAGGTIQNSIVLINSGSGWVQDNTVAANTATYEGSPVYVHSGHGSSYFGDLNGDGLLDYVFANNYQAGGINYPTFAVWYNQNGDLVWDSSVAVPWVTNIQGNSPLNFSSGAKVLDINGDGLVDFIWDNGQADTFWALLNTGHGWVQDATISQPNYVSNGQTNYVNTASPGWVLMDVNGDRLPDFARFWNDGSKAVLINNGHGWTQNDSSITVGQYSYTNESGVQTGYPDTASATMMFFDATGDGLDDMVNIAYSGGQQNWLLENTGSQANLLLTTTNPEGASYNFTYKSTAKYKDSGGNFLNPNFPAVYNTLQAMAVNDGMGNSNTTTYEYADGNYYYNNAYDREVAGFGKVTVTDPVGNKTKAYYHLGNGLQSGETGSDPSDGSLMSKSYKTERYNSGGALISQSYTDWTSFDLGNNRDFVYASKSVADESGKQVAKEYSYNTLNGNLAQEINYGKVSASANSFTDTDQDKYTTNYTYTTSGPSKVAVVVINDQAGTKVQENKFYYDNQALGTATLGNQTKVESWVTGSTYINNQKTYNGYGLPLTSTDPRGKVTQYAYDTYNLYPATITNALSQATQFTYDYGSGQVKQKTDPNTRVFQYIYDGLGRLLEEKQPDIATPATLVTKATYAYTDTSNAVSVKKSNYLDASNIVDNYVYFDGLGRKIQERVEAEGSNFSVKDYVYNNVGQLAKESVPYFSNGASKTSPTADNTLYINYSYDALGRLTTLVNALGTTTNAYNVWKSTTTDPNGKYKDFYKDAYDNLVQVDEHNAGNTYSTVYNYNYLGNLTKITDALGNIRNFTYNGLGQRLTAQDLHASADATFGLYAYTYDNAGNVTQVVNPNNQTINYTYDDINRQLTENYTGSAGVEVTNTYDAGTDGKGKLTSFVSLGMTQTNTYNALGLLKTEAKTLNAVNYTTTYDYDRQGNQTVITNPDNSQVKNIYNSAGLVDQIQRKEVSDGSFANVVNNFDYSPDGKVTVEVKANGVSSTNTYDATKLYRLTNKVTTNTGGTQLQNLAYTYDAVGNITQLVDASNGVTAKTANYIYDNLYRLLSATITNVASGQTTYAQTFTYDALGNILTKNETVGANPTTQTTYTYAGNQGASFANPHAATFIGSNALVYDNNGNVTSYTVGSGLPWYSTGGTWTTRKQLTVDHTKVSGTNNLTNFPVLVSVTDADLKTVANGGHVGKTDGTDILFTSSDGTTKLSHEIEKYDGSTGTIIAWVKVPTLTFATDTVLVLYYGNTSASDQQDKVNVWDSNTKAVWHFAEASGNFSDSTNNANAGVPTSVTRTNVKIGGGASFNGTSSTINAGSGSSLNATGNTQTIEAWVSRASTAVRPTLVTRGTSGTNGYTFGLGVSSCTTSQFKLSKLGVVDICVAGLPNNTSLHHLAMVWSNMGVTAYVDGVSVGTSTNTQNFVSSTSNFYIGSIASPFFGGTIDEMKVSNTARSADWIKTEYNNQNAPGTFMTLGSVGGGSIVTNNTWDYNNRLTQSVTGSVTTTYAYDPSGQRVKYTTPTATNYYPTKFYNTDGTTAKKHIFAPGGMVADVETTGSGGGSSPMTFDATSTSISNGFSGTATKTWSHVTSSGSNRILILSADIWQDVAGTGSITSASYNGVALTKVTSVRSSGMQSEIWYLTNPSSGSNTMSVTVTGNTDAIKLAASTFTGAMQSSVLDVSNTATGTSGNPTVSATTTTANDLVVATLSRFSTTAATTNRTSLYNNNTGAILGAASYQTAATAGSYSDTYTGSANQDWSMITATFKPVAGAGGSVTVHYNSADYLNSSSIITDSTGAVEETLDYYPYGTIRIDNKVASFTEQRKFIGQEYDLETGLNYLNARYYNAEIGRFVSEDPMFLVMGDDDQVKQLAGQGMQQYLSDPQQLNSYSYSSNNPIIKSDPSGNNPVLFGVGMLALYAPQITSYAQSLLTPVAQMSIVQSGEDMRVGNYLWGAVGLLTAGEMPGRNIGNLSRLDELPQVSVKLPEKFGILSDLTGKKSNQILKEASKFGEAFIDNANNGNVNIFVQRGEKLVTRITTDPEITKIISAGTNQVKDIVKWTQNSRLTPIGESSGKISKLVENIIKSIGK